MTADLPILSFENVTDLRAWLEGHRMVTALLSAQRRLIAGENQ